MLKAYRQSAATLNLLRALSQGGYANLNHVHQWNLGFLKDGPAEKHYEEIADRISECLDFMEACGLTPDNTPQLRSTDFYTSHEALLLGYEQGLHAGRFNIWRLVRNVRPFCLDWRQDTPSRSCAS